MNTDMHLGDRLFSARKARGLLQSELAQRTGISQSMIACIESARNGASIAKVRVLADALCVGFTWLLTGDGPDPGFPMKRSNAATRLASRPPKKTRARSLLGAHPPDAPSAQAG